MVPLDTSPLEVPSLAEKYLNQFELGVALEPETLVDQGPTVAHHFRRLTAENAMKWGPLGEQQDQYQFDRADAIAHFARRHSMKVTGHAFVWHQMNPRWLFRNGAVAADRALLQLRLQNHIVEVMQRYADVIDNWDVANEVVSDIPGKIWRDASEDSGWYEAFGDPSYVSLAFDFAVQAAERFCPQTKLYYNDYEIERREKRASTIAMIRQLRAAGVRVDGVGIQGHINLEWPTAGELADAIDEFAAEDLLVKISELDISIYCNDKVKQKVFQAERPYSPDLDERLADRYVEVFDVLSQRADKLTSVTLWGLSDDLSWLNYWPIQRKNYPLLFDAEHRPKTALRRLLGLQ